MDDERSHPSYRIVRHDPGWAAIFDADRAILAEAKEPFIREVLGRALGSRS